MPWLWYGGGAPIAPEIREVRLSPRRFFRLVERIGKVRWLSSRLEARSRHAFSDIEPTPGGVYEIGNRHRPVVRRYVIAKESP